MSKLLLLVDFALLRFIGNLVLLFIIICFSAKNMDSEIDIEEHDLLENPTIKSIFPDISILKEEISVYSVDGNV